MTAATIRHVLNELEKREMPLLSWGVTNGTFTEDEVMKVLSAVAPSEDPDELLDTLLNQGLVVTKGISGDHYRSRMAETVRLSVNLRQWFYGRDWQMAPVLVSDARFLSQARVVPTRDQEPDRLAADLSLALREEWTPEHDSALRAVLAGRSVSAFQARSTQRLLTRTPSGTGSATCITAGTGSGKTLAFYLPALTHILSSPTPEGVPRIVAIYPRTELLRDQLRGLLLTTRALADAGLRRPRVGVLYGASPRDRRDANVVRKRGWKQQPHNLVCPIIGCLEDSCEGSYLWPESAGDSEQLVCDRCGSVLDGESLSFVRKRLQSRPPEVLFTTTEMVNRLLGSVAMKRLFVGDGRRSPEFLLLDEVHTYSGSHGAQVANLLRRWRAEMSTASHVVGLSATLADPAGFFAELVGLTTSDVAVVAPAPEEMTELGREYFLALRGDPASQTSLLSTTIQTSMLLRRMLDASPRDPSEGAFGSRLFVFTDDLDVVNRLHSQLEDAEGWRPGGVNRKPNGSLATLRASGGPDVRARDEAGQLWDVAETLGTLNRPVKVSRTTSKDSGVATDADIVVATASLEVGFDDPLVGAVLQHKAPRDAAQFLQRRGRAGRDPTMRPWTVVVLSDYGRDRLAFQAYEALFDPIVQPAHLPLRNRVILKMQATWWLLDYLSRFSSGIPVSSVLSRRWRDKPDLQRQIATRVLEVVRETLTQTGIERVSGQLRRALALQDEDVRAILWDHPRALATAVLPTLARRLEAVTATAAMPEFTWPDALVEFLPSSLFAPLQTPEIHLIVPGRFGADPETEVEPVSQAMRQFAPGRVSYRYALGGRRERLWVTPPGSHDESLPLETVCPDYIEIELPENASVGRLVQPTALQLAKPGLGVPDSSYGTWQWSGAFRHEGTPLRLDCPAGTTWTDHIAAIQALTHRHRCPLTVWRFAEAFDVERRTPSEPHPTRHTLTLDGESAGVGFAMDVDALVIEVVMPSDVPDTDGLVEALRVARMEYLVRSSPLLAQQIPSSFLRDWLNQVLLSVLVKEAGDGPLAAVLARLTDDELRAQMVDAARDVFGADVIGPAQHQLGAPHDPGLVTDIDVALQSSDVLAELRQASTALSSDPDAAWLPWLQERFMVTLAAALIDAVQAACPEVDVSDLRPDFEILQGDPARPIGRIRISEDQPGGTGVIEALVDRYLEDPRAFWALVTATLGPCDGERVDLNLRGFLRASENGPLTRPVDDTRIANDLQSLTRAWAQLRVAMFGIGLEVDQSIGAALATRLLRPGSSRDLESLVADLLDRWDGIERSLGVEIDLRVFAFLAANDPSVRTRLFTAAQGQGGGRGWEIGQIVGLLWTRGGRLRSASLQSYTPYAKLEPTERLLFSHITQVRDYLVSRDSPEWREQLDAALRHRGNVTLRSATESDAAASIRDLLTEPTSVEVLEFHPRVVGLTRSGAGIDLMVELREARQ